MGDDAICLKSGRDAEGRKRARPTENVVVRDCTVLHGHGGFVIGSEMSGGVRNVHVTGCRFTGTDVGLRFKSTCGRGGGVENILIEGIEMENIAHEAIVFDLFYGSSAPANAGNSEDVGAQKDSRIFSVDETTPSFRNIVVRQIDCRGAARDTLLQGLPEMPLDNLRLESCRFVAQTGLVASNADDLCLENIAVAESTGPALALRGTRLVQVRGLRADGATPIVVVTGARSDLITLPRELSAAAVTVGSAVPSGAVRRE